MLESTLEDGFQDGADRPHECQIACRAFVVAQPQSQARAKKYMDKNTLSNLETKPSLSPFPQFHSFFEESIKTSEGTRKEQDATSLFELSWDTLLSKLS